MMKDTKADQVAPKSRTLKEMKSDLSNKSLILRFAAVSVIGTIADYLSALCLAGVEAQEPGTLALLSPCL